MCIGVDGVYIIPYRRLALAGCLPVEHAETDHSVGDSVDGSSERLLECIEGSSSSSDSNLSSIEMNTPFEGNSVG